MAGLLEHGLELVKDLGHHADALGEGFRAHRHDHEFLEVDLVVGVLAAVDDVGLGDGQNPCVGPADVAIKGQSVRRRRGLGRGQADAEDGVGPELALVRSAVGLDERAIERHLVAGIPANGHLGQRSVDVGHGMGHAFAAVALLVAVPQLDRFVDSRAGPRGNRGPAEGAVGQNHIDLHGRVAAAVKNLAPRTWAIVATDLLMAFVKLQVRGRIFPRLVGQNRRQPDLCSAAGLACPLRLAIAILPSSCTPSGTFTWIALAEPGPRTTTAQP